MKNKEYSIEIGGEKLVATFTDLAEQANGSVLLRLGDTVILATAVMSKKDRDSDFFPLTVDYEERFYAAGHILGSRFIRREGRPTDEAVLSGRIVDRTIRPLFDQHIRKEIQVVITVLSLGEHDPDILGVLGASLALATSNIPWKGPVGAIRVGKKKGEAGFVLNPSYIDREKAEYEFDLVLCGKDSLVNMIEVGGKEVAEGAIMEAMESGLEEIKKLQKFQEMIVKEIGKEKTAMTKPETPKELIELFESKISSNLFEHIFSGPGTGKYYSLEAEWKDLVKATLPDHTPLAAEYFSEQVDKLLHREAIENDRRPDGRGFDDIRPLFAKAGGISPILHGSGLFYRGATHILSALTLGGPQDSQLIDSMESREVNKRFMHHYNFPPFSTGETGRLGGMNRRMIGHGALAEKALLPVIPNKETFPYTIRIVSEAFSSNGSTSMGSVCGSTLALMDAGVPITRPVAGIASGLMMETHDKYKVLTDIQGPEDHHGDMDFKVAGTKEGVTAVQMDVKISGVTTKILTEAFEKARLARLKILEVIESEIAAPRKELSPNAPKILSTKIKPDQIGLVIGTGGKTIKDIKEKTGAEIDIDDDGTVFVTGKNGSAEAALAIIIDMTREYKAGERFDGEVTRLMDFGAFVKIGATAEGLVHVSEMAPWRVNEVTDLVMEGDKVPVVVKEIDEKGRINLSIKAANPEFFKDKQPAPGSQESSGSRPRHDSHDRPHRPHSGSSHSHHKRR